MITNSMFHLRWFVKDQLDDVGYESWEMAEDENADDGDGDSRKKTKEISQCRLHYFNEFGYNKLLLKTSS